MGKATKYLTLFLVSLVGTSVVHAAGEIVVTCTTGRVQGLQYATTPVVGQQAYFTFTATAASGYTLLSTPSWGGGLNIGGVSASTITGRATTTGIYTITAMGSVRKNSTGQTIPFAVGNIKVAAIGGPLSPSIVQGQTNDLPPTHDLSNALKPNYIQYLGYTYQSDGAKPDYMSQTPQTGSMTPLLGQPAGTTYSWSVTGSAAVVGAPLAPTASSARISASNSSGAGAISVKCTFNFTDVSDPTFTGSADDDSDITPPPGESSPRTDYYRFTAHKPTDTESYLTSVPVVTTNPYGISQNDYMRLTDHLGDGMTGVWIQERFPNLLAELQVHDSLMTLGDFTVNTDTVYWTTGTYNGYVGSFGAYDTVSTWAIAWDQLSIVLPWHDPLIVQWPYAGHANNPWVHLIHHYWAGTRNADGAATTGIDVGTWHIKMWTDVIYHTK